VIEQAGKFQIVGIIDFPEKLHQLEVIAVNAPKAAYQMETTGSDESQLGMVKKLEQDEPAHKTLLNHCQEKDIQFLSTPFDLESIDLLDRLGLSIFKKQDHCAQIAGGDPINQYG